MKVGGFGVTLLLRGFPTGCVKSIGAAVRKKASGMLWLSWQAGLQLEVAKRIATAVGQVVLDHMVLFLCVKRRIGLRKPQKSYYWKAGQSRSSPGKWLLRGELRRGASANQQRGRSVKKWLTKKSIPHQSTPFTHPPIHPSFNSFVRSFVHSLIHWFTDSLIQCFCDSVTNWALALFPNASQGFPFHSGGVGVELCSPDVAQPSATVRNRPQPPAAVRN